MSLRSRLFLLLVALAALLAAGEYWLIQRFSQDLRKELAETATQVSQRVFQIVAFHAEGEHPKEGSESGESAVGRSIVTEERRLVRHDVEVLERRDLGAGPGQKIRLVTEVGPDGQPEIRFLGPGEEAPALAQDDRNLWVEQTHDIRGPGATGTISLPPPVPIPTTGLDEAIDRFAGRFLAGTLGLLAIGLSLAAVVAHRVTAPLGALVVAAERLGRGDLGTRVPARASGEVGRALIAFNAMSDRLRALDADARALRSRQHLSELGEVGRGFAHSLRNPLNALGLAVDELARGAPGSDTAHASELSSRARRQIRRIDEALRAFLVLGTDGGRAATAPVDLVAVARDVALELAQARPEGKETVRVELAANVPVAVDGVEAELRAALQALVVNAVEASPPEGTVRVRVEAAGDDGALLEIEDQGPGIPVEVRQRLFTPHVTTKPAGAGMGLYLAHRIATTRYGGRLELADRPAGGTRATLELHGRAGGKEEPSGG